MKELPVLFLAIIAIVFIHATNKSEEKNPVDKKRNIDQKHSDRRNIQNKQTIFPVAAFASYNITGNGNEVFHSQFRWLNPQAKNQKQPASTGKSKNHPDTAGTVLSYDPSYLFYYQRIKFSRGSTSIVE
jgi:hypothetical protein